jgi:hypothetical protein
MSTWTIGWQVFAVTTVVGAVPCVIRFVKDFRR